MSKTLIFGLALAVVLVSGSYLSARADCGSDCLPRISMPSCLSCSNTVEKQPSRDYDKPDATCQGAYRYGPTTPEPMGAPGVY